jgi:glycerophosphoryl diester phosphodiesterase
MKLNVVLSVCFIFSALVALGAPDCTSEGSVTRPILIPHRGMWDEKVPQNTVEAIRRAYEAGALCVETDFHHTRHGQMVCIHTRKDLERYTGSKKRIPDLTPEDIKTLNLGEKSGLSRIYRIPLIDEVLAVVPKDRVLQAEIKGYSKEYPDLFDAAVKKAGLSESNIVVSAFSYDALKDMKARYPKYRTIHLVRLPKDKAFPAEYWIDKCKKANIDVFCPHSASTVGVMTRADADAIRAAGLDFRVYGVKTREHFHQAAKLGASGFTCDFWDVVFKWAKELEIDYHPVTRK